MYAAITGHFGGAFEPVGFLSKGLKRAQKGSSEATAIMERESETLMKYGCG